MKHLGVVAAALLLCILLCTGLAVRAEDSLPVLFEASGADELGEAYLPEGADVSDPASFTSMTLPGLLQTLAGSIADRLGEPLRVLTLLMGVILLSALAASMKGEQSAAGTVYEVVCVLCAVGIACEPMSRVFLQAAEVLKRTADLMLTFSGIFGGVLAVGGGLTVSAVYQSSMAVLCELALEVAAKFLLPLLGMCLAMSIVDAVNPAISLEGMIKLIQKVSAWVLGLLMALFLGMLSVQSMVAVSADRAGTKAAKYMISGFVPIVGGAVSEAYAAVLGSMGILRSTTGMIGILALLSILVPVLAELGIYRLLAAIAAAVSELFGTKQLTRLFRNMESVMATGFSIAVCFSVMFIFSTAVMMLLGGTQT